MLVGARPSRQLLPRIARGGGMAARSGSASAPRLIGTVFSCAHWSLTPKKVAGTFFPSLRRKALGVEEGQAVFWAVDRRGEAETFIEAPGRPIVLEDFERHLRASLLHRRLLDGQ